MKNIQKVTSPSWRDREEARSQVHTDAEQHTDLCIKLLLYLNDLQKRTDQDEEIANKNEKMIKGKKS